MDILRIDGDDHSVALPIDKKTLGNFISGLLGQPQSISRRFEEAFSADHQWFIHFFSLILQRIQQQNSPEPLFFEADILYKNKIRRKVTTWQAFQHFSETQNIVSVGVKFNLALLIQFPSKEIPERQDIVISFDAAEKKKTSGILDSFLGFSTTTGIIDVEIRHTERTWADDILRLIETEISNIQAPDQNYRIYLRKLFGILSTFSFPVMMLGSLFYSSWHKGSDELDKKAAELIKLGDVNLQAIHEKLNFLILQAQLKTGEVVNGGKVFIYSFFIATTIFFVSSFLSQPNPSFVILSNAAERYKTKTTERLKRRGLVLLISTIASVVLGIAGNFIYDSIK